MRALVTGAGGLLGRPLVRELARRGHEVAPADLPDTDVTDPAAARRAVEGSRPDLVLHLAAWTDVDGCERDPARSDAVNAGGARNVAAACREAGVAMLHVSTDYVFDGTKDGPWNEDDPVGPLSAYGRSKLAAERHVRELVPRWTIVRAQSLYGAGPKSFPDAILARARKGEPLRVVTDQRVSPTWVEDLAAGIASVAEREVRGLLHVANAGSCTWWECARATLDLAGLRDVPVGETTAAAFARPAPRPANSAFDCSRFSAAAGAPLRPWRDALAAYLSTRTEVPAA